MNDTLARPLGRTPRKRRSLSKWLIGGALIGLLWFAWGIYEEFSYFPEADTTITPVHRRNLEAKNHMLDLVNEARVNEGSPPVTLGTNNAAQLHAEQGVEECATSHWDKFGLKPYMRYSLAGGSNHNGENIATYFTCVDGQTEGPFSWSLLFDHDVNTAVEDSVQGLLDSPGHRETMLEPDFSIMNAGIAWNKQAFNIVQHFETDLVRFSEGPELAEGLLSMKGATKGIPDFSDDHGLIVLILYDPPPARLGPNQLVRTSCYSQGEPILAIRKQPPGGKSYAEGSLTIEEEMETCPDPYKISRKVRAPRSIEDVERISERAKRSVREREVKYTISFVEAEVWNIDGNSFQMMADLSAHLREPGVYTVLMLTSKEEGDGHTLAEKSFFHEVRAPRYYARE